MQNKLSICFVKTKETKAQQRSIGQMWLFDIEHVSFQCISKKKLPPTGELHLIYYSFI